MWISFGSITPRHLVLLYIGVDIGTSSSNALFLSLQNFKFVDGEADQKTDGCSDEYLDMLLGRENTSNQPPAAGQQSTADDLNGELTNTDICDSS